ncbi:MAG: hypothetical protein L0H83_07075 [Salinisphaera sp.]|nr:hypothetical protein [Salinisphaera sp.]
MRLAQWLIQAVSRWLAQETQPAGMPLNDFERLCEQLRPADVILVEGRSRFSGVIQAVTLSSWTHAALYLGRLGDLADRDLAAELTTRHGWSEERQLLIEAEIDRGCVITPVDSYAPYHLRLCRPRNLLPADRDAVLAHALANLGRTYNLRQVLDLLRFFFPYGLLPRRWRSTLFEAGHGEATRVICSTMIAKAFEAVRFPILPILHRAPGGGYVFHQRNARIYVPRDFDYSPYFDIIKYPFFGDDDVRLYRELRWDDAQRTSVPRKRR